MIAGDDGWDDPVPLPEDDDASRFGHQGQTPPPPPAAPPPAAPPPGPGPAPATARAPGATGASSLDQVANMVGGMRNLMIAAGAIIVVIVIIVVVSGGGGGGGSTLSQSAFVSKGNGICMTLGAKVQSDESGGNTSQAEKDLQDGINQLAALKPPKADQATMKEVVSDLNSAVSDLKSGNASQASTDGDNADPLLNQVGLNTCAGL
jgi:hypothetical protein